ncbi:MAG: hypothetical protein V1768_00565 [Patescibacteria group bacterium]|nr:hypothetical protein [Patescibacteria group bacterium]MBU2474520.1 hypothetical protein [Patescibacteria group bacterium]
MYNQCKTNQITFPKTIFAEQGTVVLGLKVYERMQDKIRKLQEELKNQHELEEVKTIIAEGDEDRKQGKTVEMREFFKQNHFELYGKYFNKG